MVNETKKERKIKIADIINIADIIKGTLRLGLYILLICGVSYIVKEGCKKSNLARQFLKQHSIEQKVEFSEENGRIMGYTEPNLQRIYIRQQDIDNDGWADEYYIENPFSKDKFRIGGIDYGKNHIPQD
jgi:hypothetical protein